MGSLFSTLDVARSGLFSAQAALDVTAHNVANVNNPEFSRQRVSLSARRALVTPQGQFGRGVSVDNIERIRNTFLDVSYRNRVSGLGESEVLAQYYNLIDDALLEPTDVGMGVRLSNFFDAMSELSGTVEEVAVREVVLGESQNLVRNVRDLVSRLDGLRTEADGEIRNMIPQINTFSEQIADLNHGIVRAEANGTSANDMRDQRDAIVDELARLVNVNTRLESDGSMSVLLGSDVLVNHAQWNELEAVREPALDPERNDLHEVRFVESGLQADVRGGELHARLRIRDEIVPELDGRLDTLVGTLIEEVNSIHSQANGLENLTGTITGGNQVDDPANPLVAAGLPFDVTEPGSFDIVLTDATSVVSQTTINIGPGTTLNDVAADLNAVANVSAAVVDNRLEITVDPAFSFTFANDSSNALTALGVNGYFTGHDARSLGLNQDLVEHPEWVSTGYSLDPLNTGDNTAARDMAQVRALQPLDSGTSTIHDYYEATVSIIGVDARSNLENLEVEEVTIEDLQTRRLEISGVSLDEEVTNMIQFQRAFEASARMISVVDEMLQTVIALGQ